VADRRHLVLSTSYARWVNGHEDNSPENGTCRTMEVNLRQGSQMASQLELSARAALCRQLAKREPANRALWLAEAENWSRLSKRNFAASQSKDQAADSNATVAGIRLLQ
jgi:hypothetical protein